MPSSVVNFAAGKLVAWPVLGPGIGALGRFFTRGLYRRPIFVIGAARSGTSILIQSLGQHPRILAPGSRSPIYGESFLFSHFGRIAFQFTSGHSVEFFRACCKLPVDEAFDRMRQFLFESQWGPRFGCFQFRYLWLRRRSKRHWLAKALYVGPESAEGLRSLYPQAKFLHIHRNGLDAVASSRRFAGFRDWPFDKQCRMWADQVKTYQFLSSWEHALTLSHKDLTNRREQTFRAIFRFLGLEPHDAPIRYAETTLVHPQDQPTLTGTNVSGLLTNRSPAYKAWSEEEKRTFKTICGDAMQGLGYEVPF